MNDLFRAIFGVPDSEQYGERMDNTSSNDRRNIMDNGGDDDDDDDNMRGNGNGRGEMGILGFPFFNDPVDIHKHFERLLDDMNKTFGMFGFGSGPSITWEDENSNIYSFNDQPVQGQESLRDSFLKKPDCTCDRINQNDFNSKLDEENFAAENTLNSESQFSFPKIVSKSVFIQTVRRPDGSVETIKKVRDHTGNEETTITQTNMNDPPPLPQDNPQVPKEDTSGISIFKKFFPF